jgi:hypothetical protein
MGPGEELGPLSFEEVSVEVNKDPQEVPGFVMEGLRAARREEPYLRSKEYLPRPWQVARPMFWQGHVDAVFWMMDNPRESRRMMDYGAVSRGYRPIPCGWASYKEVSAYHKARYGEGTMNSARH